MGGTIMTPTDVPKREKKREGKRHPPRTQVKVFCFQGAFGMGRNVALTLENLSEKGACVKTSAPLNLGQEVQVHLESVQHPRAVVVDGQVVWARSLGDRHQAGVRFERPLAWKDFQLLARS
jgi:hypothetical protein